MFRNQSRSLKSSRKEFHYTIISHHYIRCLSPATIAIHQIRSGRRIIGIITHSGNTQINDEFQRKRTFSCPHSHCTLTNRKYPSSDYPFDILIRSLAIFILRHKFAHYPSSPSKLHNFFYLRRKLFTPLVPIRLIGTQITALPITIIPNVQTASKKTTTRRVADAEYNTRSQQRLCLDVR